MIGLPSAGKSSLLNELTNAESKVGAYHFTTLEPHLGEMYGYIIADIPGLIEGAHTGKGLGHSFLRHIRRTRVLVHCVDVNRDAVVGDYTAVRSELHEYDPAISEKREVVVLTKRDEVDDDVFTRRKEKLKSVCDTVVAVSILDERLLKDLRDYLIGLAREEDKKQGAL